MVLLLSLTFFQRENHVRPCLAGEGRTFHLHHRPLVERDVSPLDACPGSRCERGDEWRSGRTAAFRPLTIPGRRSPFLLSSPTIWTGSQYSRLQVFVRVRTQPDGTEAFQCFVVVAEHAPVFENRAEVVFFFVKCKASLKRPASGSSRTSSVGAAVTRSFPCMT